MFTGVALVSLALAPFTCGVSAVVVGVGAAVGTGVGIAGGLTSSGATVVEHFKSKAVLIDAEKIWEEFKIALYKHLARLRETDPQDQEHLQKRADLLNEMLSKQEPTPIETEIVQKLLMFGAPVAQEMGKAALKRLAPKAAANGAENAVAKGAEAAAQLARGAQAVSNVGKAGQVLKALTKPVGIFNIISLGLSIYEIVDASVEIHMGKGAPQSACIRDLARNIMYLVEILEKLENEIARKESEEMKYPEPKRRRMMQKATR